MAELQARIGPKATKVYPNLTWKRPGVDLQSPSKNTARWSKPHQSHEKEFDNDASSHASLQAFSSPNKFRSKSDHRSRPSRPKQSSGPLSLLSRMGLNSGVSEDGASEEEEASIQQSLLTRVGMTEETPRSSPIIGSTLRDTAHVLDCNGYHDIASSKHARRLSSSQPALPPSSNGQENASIEPLDNQYTSSSHNNDDPIVKPSTKEASSPRSFHSLHDSFKSNHSPNNIETSQIDLEEGLAVENLPKFSPSQEQVFEEGELVDSEPLPSQQVREFLLPLVLENAANREKEGDSDLSRHTAHSVLSDEVCASFMDKMKEVRTEMHAHKNRLSHNSPQMQFTAQANNPEVANTLPISKIGQAPPSAPRAMNFTIKTRKSMPYNGKIVSKDLSQPISAGSSHSHDPVSSSIQRRREPEFGRTPSPERRDFHDHDRGRYPQDRPRFDGHRSRSRSRSPSRYSRVRPYHRSSGSSRHRARSRSPVTLATSGLLLPHRRPSSTGVFLPDLAVRESPDEISSHGPEVPGTSSHDRILERPLRDFKRIDESISPRWDTADSPRSPVYRRHFSQRGADKVASPRRASFTYDRSPELDSETSRHRKHVGSGSEFARRSASPRRKHRRQFSAERPFPCTLSRQPTPSAYCQSPPASFKPSHREQSSYHLSPAGSMSSHLSDSAAGSYHQVTKLMAIDNGLPKTTDDVQQSELSVLPCRNVPGVWFIKVALDDIGTLECSFEVDEATALKWNLQNTKEHIFQGEKLQLQICCLSQKLVQSLMDSLKPDATAQDVAAAMVSIENDWPTPGHLIIMVNPQDKNKRVWLPDKLGPSSLPVCIEDCVFEGQNIVQFIQLSGMSGRMFVLFATKPPLDELQYDVHQELVLAPLKDSIDGCKGDTFEIGFGKVTIAGLI